MNPESAVPIQPKETQFYPNLQETQYTKVTKEEVKESDYYYW